MWYKSILFFILCIIIFVSGCTESSDVTQIVEQLPQVQQFMEEHPDATITVTYWSQEEVAAIQDELSQDFGKTITPKPMYKAVTSAGNLVVVTWIDAETQIVLYTHTESANSNQNPEQTPEIEPLPEIPTQEPELPIQEPEPPAPSTQIYNGHITEGDGYQINDYVIDVTEVFFTQNSIIVEVYKNGELQDDALLSQGASHKFNFENDATIEVNIISFKDGIIPSAEISILLSNYDFSEIHDMGVVPGGHEYAT